MQLFAKKHDFWVIMKFLKFSKISLFTKNHKQMRPKNTPKNDSFSEWILKGFACILRSLFPLIFALFRVPKGNERKSADPYETLPLCSEMKGWPFEKRSKINQKSLKSTTKNTSETKQWKKCVLEGFRAPFWETFGRLWGTKAHGKNDSEKRSRNSLGITGTGSDHTKKLSITQFNY